MFRSGSVCGSLLMIGLVPQHIGGTVFELECLYSGVSLDSCDSKFLEKDMLVLIGGT